MTAKNIYGKLKLDFYPYSLHLRHTFSVAGNTRGSTPAVMTQISYGGITAYGEASLPPYLGETQRSVLDFLRKVDLSGFDDPFRLEEILGYVDSLDKGNNAAKASIDIALHDLVGKLLGKPLYSLWGLSPEKASFTSFTIGIDTPLNVKMKIKEASGFKVLKVKLGSGNDMEIIRAVREVTGVPLFVDVNQGWNDRHEALEMIFRLKEQGAVLVEQPLHSSKIDDMAWLTENSPLPTIADEACRRLPDVAKVRGVYSGINIKLMKSTGLREAQKMITVAKALGMKIMIGCMTETSCAVSAAAQLSPLADWTDLDGNLLIDNDLFEGVKAENGRIVLSDRPGIGIIKKIK